MYHSNSFHFPYTDVHATDQLSEADLSLSPFCLQPRPNQGDDEGDTNSLSVSNSDDDHGSIASQRQTEIKPRRAGPWYDDYSLPLSFFQYIYARTRPRLTPRETALIRFLIDRGVMPAEINAYKPCGWAVSTISRHADADNMKEQDMEHIDEEFYHILVEIQGKGKIQSTAAIRKPMADRQKNKTRASTRAARVRHVVAQSPTPLRRGLPADGLLAKGVRQPEEVKNMRPSTRSNNVANSDKFSGLVRPAASTSNVEHKDPHNRTHTSARATHTSDGALLRAVLDDARLDQKYYQQLQAVGCTQERLRQMAGSPAALVEGFLADHLTEMNPMERFCFRAALAKLAIPF
ncbi:hypothetical protein C8R43DRAFT_1132295 [Mycena crocata]|nr:hypothetical protein C8R43DRAFT_1132295 [Mycena crocata]